MLLTFHVNPKNVLTDLKAHAADFNKSNGVIAREIRSGMHEVYERVDGRFKRLYRGPRRRFINSNAEFTSQAAPRVLKSVILSQLKDDRSAKYYLTVNDGVFTFGLGNVDNFDEATDEAIISSMKAKRGEVPEQRRDFFGRDTYSLWRIIEFGATKHTISPKKQGVNLLMFFSHKYSALQFAKETEHKGQSGKHIFLRTEHEVYQKDVSAIESAVLRGLRKQIKQFYKR